MSIINDFSSAADILAVVAVATLTFKFGHSVYKGLATTASYDVDTSYWASRKRAKASHKALKAKYPHDFGDMLHGMAGERLAFRRVTGMSDSRMDYEHSRRRGNRYPNICVTDIATLGLGQRPFS